MPRPKKAPAVHIPPPPPTKNPLTKVENKELLATHRFDEFPPELRLRCDEAEPYRVWVELFGQRWKVFASPTLILHCAGPRPRGVNSGGSLNQVHYELVDEHHRSGLTFKVYRKYRNARRVMESTGAVLP